MPAIASMIEEGASGDLRAVMPPVTPPSWSSFYTAMNPGKHGVFEFEHRVPGEYRFSPVNSTFLRKPPFWSLLSEAGYRVGVVNVPLAYPPQKVNGVVVGGILTPPGVDDHIYPPEFAIDLARAVPGYTSWPPELQLGHGNEETYIRTHAELIDAQFAAMEHAMMWLGEWDLFFGAVQFPDQIFHWFWKHDDPSHPRHGDVREEYRGVVRRCHMLLDRHVATLREAAGPDALTMIVSDHGNGPLLRELYVDTLLAERGWTRFKRGPLTAGKQLLRRAGFTPSSGFKAGHSLGLGGLVRKAMRFQRGLLDKAIAMSFISLRDVDWARSKAYAYGSWGSIYINLRGREPQGCVAPADYEGVRTQIIEDLRTVIDPTTGKPVFAQVLERESVYSGDEIGRGPDIFVVPADESVHPAALLPFPTRHWIGEPFSSESGWHRQHGIVLIAGPGVSPGTTLEGARIEDASATIMSYLGAGTTDDMDGLPLTAGFEADSLSVGSMERSDAGVADAVQPYSDEERELINKRLSDLGY